MCPTFDILSATYCTCYPAFSLHLIIPLFIMTASHPSASEGPIYSTKIRSGHKKHRGGDVSSSSGLVYRPGSFMVVFCRGRGGGVAWRDPGLDPNSEHRDLWPGNKPRFRTRARSQISMTTTQKNQPEKRSRSTATQGQEGKRWRETEKWRYMRIWDGFDGGGGYISKWMFGSLDGTRFPFPTEDENGQERMKG